jgi:uncharacterized protein YdhG (YjbR/CyaY superfamily)
MVLRRSIMSKTGDVDAYLAKTSPTFRAALNKLRRTIASSAPSAEEGFSYGVPAFILGSKPLVCFAAFKNHCGFYPMSPAVIAQFADELSGFETAKGTIRFKPGKQIPVGLVKKIVRARITEMRKKPK